MALVKTIMEEKNWIEKIEQGMELIKQGCSENAEWTECYKCPFDKYCDMIYDGTEWDTPGECF